MRRVEVEANLRVGCEDGFQVETDLRFGCEVEANLRFGCEVRTDLRFGCEVRTDLRFGCEVQCVVQTEIQGVTALDWSRLCVGAVSPRFTRGWTVLRIQIIVILIVVHTSLVCVEHSYNKQFVIDLVLRSKKTKLFQVMLCTQNGKLFHELFRFFPRIGQLKMCKGWGHL